MNRKKSGGSELRKVFIFLGVLLILLVGSFFVGMYLGSEVPEKPTVISQSDGNPRPDAAVSSVRDKALSEGSEEEPGADAPSVGEPDIEAPSLEPGVKLPVQAPDGEAPPKKSVSAGPVYSVQVGAFRDEQKAEERAAQLLKKGYEAYIVPPVSGEKSSLIKVRIGKFSKREDADALSKKIRQKEGIQAFVTYR